MASPVKVNYTIYQGSTFEQVLRWESGTKVYVPITNIDNSAPVVITAAGHNIPVGWRTKVSNVVGMKEINSGEDYYQVSDTTINTITINSINAISFTAYTSGGVLEYNAPIDLDGYTARMQVREKLESTDILLELTSINGKILLDNVLKTITINIPASDTTGITWSSAVYSMELEKNGRVIPFITGKISVVKEVTR